MTIVVLAALIRRDQAGAKHVYGVLEDTHYEYLKYRYFWGKLGSGTINIGSSEADIRGVLSKLTAKEDLEYKEIALERLKKQWPDYLYLIEQEVLVNRLKNSRL